MHWSKEMSVTDAQQPTTGRVVPYMRFTKSGNPQDNQTWFRNTLFAGEKWRNSSFGSHPVERCDVKIDVSIAGQNMGPRDFFVTHDSTRMNNNSTPNTWLHYDQNTLVDLKNINTTGMIFTISKTSSGYALDIS
jgi:hypothetical protein